MIAALAQHVYCFCCPFGVAGPALPIGDDQSLGDRRHFGRVPSVQRPAAPIGVVEADEGLAEELLGEAEQVEDNFGTVALIAAKPAAGLPDQDVLLVVDQVGVVDVLDVGLDDLAVLPEDLLDLRGLLDHQYQGHGRPH